MHWAAMRRIEYILYSTFVDVRLRRSFHNDMIDTAEQKIHCGSRWVCNWLLFARELPAPNACVRHARTIEQYNWVQVISKPWIHKERFTRRTKVVCVFIHLDMNAKHTLFMMFWWRWKSVERSTGSQRRNVAAREIWVIITSKRYCSDTHNNILPLTSDSFVFYSSAALTFYRGG